jgi:hypothetical protein
MRHVSMKPILATAAFGALLGGCATTVEMGPGYYHYDTGLARPTAPAAVYREPAVVYREPAVVYEPTVVYRGVYREPSVVYRYGRDSFFYTDHGQ